MKHHKHFTTSLATNFKFTIPDIIIESTLPIFVGLLFLRNILKIKLSRKEVNLLMIYIAWHETGTHMGKPLQTISIYPPLSFLYREFFKIDINPVKFHEIHHRRRDCNYGITSWIDYLLKTYQES